MISTKRIFKYPFFRTGEFTSTTSKTTSWYRILKRAQISRAQYDLGTFIATAPISDKDSASLFGRLSFGLEPEAKFAIEKETGVISLNSQLDYESKSEWNVVIVATDGGGLTTRCKFVVLVEDANEAAPVFQHPTSDDLELLINENEQEKAEIFSVKAIDPDFNPLSSQGPKVTYKLDGAQELLKIDEISGEVTLNKSIAQLQEDQKTFRIIAFWFHFLFSIDLADGAGSNKIINKCPLELHLLQMFAAI